MISPLAQAQLHLERKELELLLELCHRSLATQEQRHLVLPFLLLRSQAHLGLNDFTSALDDAQRAVDVDPENSEAFSILGSAHLALANASFDTSRGLAREASKGATQRLTGSFRDPSERFPPEVMDMILSSFDTRKLASLLLVSRNFASIIPSSTFFSNLIGSLSKASNLSRMAESVKRLSGNPIKKIKLHVNGAIHQDFQELIATLQPADMKALKFFEISGSFINEKPHKANTSTDAGVVYSTLLSFLLLCPNIKEFHFLASFDNSAKCLKSYDDFRNKLNPALKKVSLHLPVKGINKIFREKWLKVCKNVTIVKITTNSDLEKVRSDPIVAELIQQNCDILESIEIRSITVLGSLEDRTVSLPKLKSFKCVRDFGVTALDKLSCPSIKHVEIDLLNRELLREGAQAASGVFPLLGSQSASSLETLISSTYFPTFRSVLEFYSKLKTVKVTIKSSSSLPQLVQILSNTNICPELERLKAEQLKTSELIAIVKARRDPANQCQPLKVVAALADESVCFSELVELVTVVPIDGFHITLPPRYRFD